MGIRTIARRIVEVVGGGGGGVNTTVQVKPAIDITPRADGAARRVETASGVAVSQGPLTARVAQNPAAAVTTRASGTPVAVATTPGVDVDTRASGSPLRVAVAKALSVALGPLLARIQQKPAIGVTARAGGSPVSSSVKPAVDTDLRVGLKPVQQSPAAEIVRVVYSLNHRSGVQSQSVSGDAWTNPSNVLGIHNGTVASISASLTAAKSSVFTLPFADFVNKTDLTITTVRLHYYCSQTGTVLNNAATRLRYDFGGTDIELEILTGDVSSLTTPRTFDITASVGGSWTQLNALRGIISFQSATAESYTFNLDAIELEVIATRTDTP